MQLFSLIEMIEVSFRNFDWEKSYRIITVRCSRLLVDHGADWVVSWLFWRSWSLLHLLHHCLLLKGHLSLSLHLSMHLESIWIPDWLSKFQRRFHRSGRSSDWLSVGVELRLLIGYWDKLVTASWCCVYFSWCFSVDLALMAAKWVDMSELLQTDSAFVWLFTSVNSHVDCKGAKLWECRIAKSTSVWFLASMNALVNLK